MRHLGDNTGTYDRRDSTQEISKGNSRLTASSLQSSPERAEHRGLQERNESGTLSQMFGHLENNVNGYSTDIRECMKM